MFCVSLTQDSNFKSQGLLRKFGSLKRSPYSNIRWPDFICLKWESYIYLKQNYLASETFSFQYISGIWSIYLFTYLFSLKFSFLCNSEISICLTVPCVLTFPFQIHLFLLGAETECFHLFLSMALGRREWCSVWL